MKKTITLLALVAGFISFAGTANAALITYNITFSGAAYPVPNSATAIGTITLDNLPNPGSTSDFSKVIALTLTVSGASTGNGVFTISDFQGFAWDTGAATLDLNTELVGQSTPESPWGTAGGGGGDFNLVGARGSGAPTATGSFMLTTAGGAGDTMLLTSMSPASTPVPEPGTWAAAALLAGGAGFMRWRKRTKVS